MYYKNLSKEKQSISICLMILYDKVMHYKKHTQHCAKKKTPAAINDEAGGSKLSQLIIAPVDSIVDTL